MIHYISAERLTIARVEEILTKGYKLALSEDAVKRTASSMTILRTDSGR